MLFIVHVGMPAKFIFCSQWHILVFKNEKGRQIYHSNVYFVIFETMYPRRRTKAGSRLGYASYYNDCR